MIDEQKFETFEKIRASGKVNMNNTDQVSELSGDILSKKDVEMIIRSYGEYQEQFRR